MGKRGERRKTNEEYLAECKDLIAQGYTVDSPYETNQTVMKFTCGH